MSKEFKNSTEPSNSSNLPNASLHVMVVDDDAFMCQILADMLSSLGAAKVTVCSNVEKAISNLHSLKMEPNLILCDLHMPGRDGFQFMEELAKKNYAGSIALLSGQQNHVLHSGKLMARFHQLPILAALEKPATREQIQSLLERVCQEAT